MKPCCFKEDGSGTLPEEIISGCLQKGRERLWPLNYFERLRLKKGVHVPLSYQIDNGQLQKCIESLKRSLKGNRKMPVMRPVIPPLHRNNTVTVSRKNSLSRNSKNPSAKDMPLIITVPVDDFLQSYPCIWLKNV